MLYFRIATYFFIQYYSYAKIYFVLFCFYFKTVGIVYAAYLFLFPACHLHVFLHSLLLKTSAQGRDGLDKDTRAHT